MPLTLGIFGWIVGLLVLVFKFLLSLAKLIGKALASMFLCFVRIGLLLPLLYGFFGLVLYLLQKLTPNSDGATWYLVGYVAVILLSILFALRKQNKRKQKAQKEAEESCRQVQKEAPQNEAGKPMVYRSVNHPDIVIYEYADRTEQYREIDGKRILVGTQKKQKKGKK